MAPRFRRELVVVTARERPEREHVAQFAQSVLFRARWSKRLIQFATRTVNYLAPTGFDISGPNREGF